MQSRIKAFLKTGLAILLFICLLDMPYGYYELVRFLAIMVFVFLGYSAYQEKNEIRAYIFFGLAILFQPLLKIALGRDIWNMVDVVVGIWLLYLVYEEILRKRN